MAVRSISPLEGPRGRFSYSTSDPFIIPYTSSRDLEWEAHRTQTKTRFLPSVRLALIAQHTYTVFATEGIRIMDDSPLCHWTVRYISCTKKSGKKWRKVWDIARGREKMGRRVKKPKKKLKNDGIIWTFLHLSIPWSLCKISWKFSRERSSMPHKGW